jgi:hypothetical protein
VGEAAPARMDVITRHRLCMLGLDADGVIDGPLAERLRTTYRGFVERVPYENLSDNLAAAEHPNEPDAWPRTTDRFLRDHRAHGLGGTSFTLAYALRDLFRGLGGNAHCTLGRNLVTEEVHAAVVVYEEDGPWLFDPALLLAGPIPVRPDGLLEDPLGHVTLRPCSGPTLTVSIRGGAPARIRPVYAVIPVPTSPPCFRQAWIASFCRGRPRPVWIARRRGDEILRYGERLGTLETLRAGGRETERLGEDRCAVLQERFGISAAHLERWFRR